jgi:KaiC/GvpD/RAD55 family RecA-like ATPase
MMAHFVRLTKGVADKGKLVPQNEVFDHIEDSEKDYYASAYLYNDEQVVEFKKTGTVRGIKNVVTNRIWFDFDTSEDPSFAQIDAKEAIRRLEKYGIQRNNIEIYFSGNKGFHLVVTLNKFITPEQVYNICVKKFGQDLESLDSAVYDPSRIFRVPGTKHQKSGLYKIPLTYNQLFTLNINQIKNLASSLDNITEDFEWEVAAPKEELFVIEDKKSNKREIIPELLDFSKKPNQWKNCKWALLQGNFKEGERHNALMVIAATCRGLGYDKDTTYYMCKSAMKKQAMLTGQEEFNKEELYTNIIEQSVFTDNWEGGQYSCQKPGWLQTYCTSLGEHKCKTETEEPPVIQVTDMGSLFSSYAQNFEQNIIKTGIPKLDDRAMICASTLNGLLGQPGAGKTSMSLQYLLNTSKNDIHSTFFSLDMGMPIVYAKMVQKLTGYDFKEVLRIFKEDPKLSLKLSEQLKEDYKNVGFNFKSGLTVPDLKRTIVEQQEEKGEKVKLVVIDYLECLAGPYSDQTANTGFIANQLKDLANDLSVAVLLLLQTQKHSTPDVSDPLLSLKGVKGSSLIEQSCSSILTLWREGYNPKTVADDKYISFAIVKNRFGSLWSGDFSWHGVTGDIRELTEEEDENLAEFRARKAQAKLEAAQEKTGWE